MQAPGLGVWSQSSQEHRSLLSKWQTQLKDWEDYIERNGSALNSVWWGWDSKWVVFLPGTPCDSLCSSTRGTKEVELQKDWIGHTQGKLSLGCDSKSVFLTTFKDSDAFIPTLILPGSQPIVKSILSRIKAWMLSKWLCEAWLWVNRKNQQTSDSEEARHQGDLADLLSTNNLPRNREPLYKSTNVSHETICARIRRQCLE